MRYDLVTETVEILSERGWHSQVIAQADGYPVFLLKSDPATSGNPGGRNGAAALPKDRGAGTPPASPTSFGGSGRLPLLIAAGIHGEEPASVVGLCRWLRERVEEWRNSLRFTVFPCINPWGFERGIRFAADGKDLNRQFDAPQHPAVAAVCRSLEASGERFPLFVDLHEDCDFEAMYLYEVIDPSQRQDGAPTLGRRILDRARRRVGLYSGPVEDLQARDGMIHVDGFDRIEARKLRGLPIALYAYAHFVPHVVTVETPGKLPLQVRAGLHVEALEEACSYLLERERLHERARP